MSLGKGKRVLLLGADGFIGRHFAFYFRSMGYDVLCSARQVSRLRRLGFETLRADLADPATHTPEFWREKLSDVRFLVNAAGLLTGSEARFLSVHVLAPRAIYDAMPKRACGVLISAVGIGADTDFARYRRQGEEVAASAPIPVSAIRPGLVLADTSFGGSSLLRAHAALPFVTPLIAKGDQRFNPVHVDDLARVVHEALEQTDPEACRAVGGPEIVTLKEMLVAYRRWFGLPEGHFLQVPVRLAQLIGKMGDMLRLGPLSATSVAQLNEGVLATDCAPIREGGHLARAFSEFLAARPAGTQDLWHARLFLLRPVLRFSLVLLWLVSGLLGFFLPASDWLPLVRSDLLADPLAITLARGFGLIDLAIAAALIRLWRPRLLGFLQLAMVAGYSAGLSLLAPMTWLDPIGGLLKNIPVLALILVWMVLEEEK